jgi:hypothetical protein
VDVKAGFWQDVYKGPLGRFVVGVELEYLKRTAFSGIGGAPSTDNIVGFTSLRYYFHHPPVVMRLAGAHLAGSRITPTRRLRGGFLHREAICESGLLVAANWSATAAAAILRTSTARRIGTPTGRFGNFRYWHHPDMPGRSDDVR